MNPPLSRESIQDALDQLRAVKAAGGEIIDPAEKRCLRCGDVATVYVKSTGWHGRSGPYCCRDCFLEEQDVRTPFPGLDGPT